MKATSAVPVRKVGASAIAGAVAAIIWWIVGATTSVEAPPEVVAASVTLLTVIVGYLVPERAGAYE